MNLRTCQYFLAICEAGSFHGAARKLYISPQSLSERIIKLEKKLGTPLFHRESPLTLTSAGECMKTAAQKVVEAIDQLERDISSLQTDKQLRITLGIIDHGIPPFLPLVEERFLENAPGCILETTRLLSGAPISESTSFVISSHEVSPALKSEVLLKDRLSICLSDSLLRKLYGDDWKSRKNRLSNGDLTAIENCPMVRQTDPLLTHWASQCFAAAGYIPSILPVQGHDDALADICASGQAAMVLYQGVALHKGNMPPVYPMPHSPEDIPCCYLSYPANRPLTDLEQTFLHTCRQVLRHLPESAHRPTG